MNDQNKAARSDSRVWVICEGKHEQGGALSEFVRRLQPDIEFWNLEFELWKNPRGTSRRCRKTGKGDGVFNKLAAILIDAEENAFNAVICVIDQDCDLSRRQSVAKAQALDRFFVPRAFGVAVEKFDAWFLADEIALSSICEKTVDRQPDPESIRDPKSIAISMIEKHQIDLTLSEFYANLASKIQLESLRKRCPKGFAAWAERVSELEFS